MSNLLPLVEELADSETHAARADWLLQVPDGVVLRDFGAIRIILLGAGFLLGVDFLHLRHAALHATRFKDGELPPAVLDAVRRGRKVMVDVALGKAAAGEGQAE